MAKQKVVVLHHSTGLVFGFGEREVVVSDKMNIGDAEHLEKMYPGVYVKVVDEPATRPLSGAAKAAAEKKAAATTTNPEPTAVADETKATEPA